MRIGHGRSHGAMLVSNLAEPLIRLGRWREALGLITEALADEPNGVFASTLLLLQSFYTDRNGMKEDYFRLWDKLSSHYSSNPGVLGFDLFNEPL